MQNEVTGDNILAQRIKKGIAGVELRRSSNALVEVLLYKFVNFCCAHELFVGIQVSS